MPEHQELQDRIEQLVVFRKQHDSLRTVICRVVKPGPDGEVPPEDRRILEDVDAAYNVREYVLAEKAAVFLLFVSCCDTDSVLTSRKCALMFST